MNKLVQKVKWNFDTHPTEMYVYGDADLEANQAMQEPLEKLYQLEDLADGLTQQLAYYVERMNKAMEAKNYLSVSENAAMISKLAYACQLFDGGGI